ncbi:MAG: UDP-3-O-(3-hydroxymyristoyl)glucosamine N-acyltransferase [Dissulfuribacterales bacterium]|nr:UDP-3-O-(3-hydroxymyristoyl)glucosamine N-acyltransferase [Deltaproteobacteria bacterium]
MKTLGEIALLIKGDLKGPGDFPVSGIQALTAAGPDEISFAAGPRYREDVERSRAGAMILPKDWPYPLDRPSVLVEDPYLAYALTASAFSDKPFSALGVSSESHVGSGCEIDRNVSIYPGVYIGDRVHICPYVTLHPGVYVGNDVCIEEGTTLYPNVVVYEGCRIGKRVAVHAGTVIGSDGFGYARRGEYHVKIPQIGIVVIEDDVEIGANCTIDRAALGETRIGRGTKIDNLVQVGHNVSVGAGSLIVAQVGVSGSTRLGRGVVLGGQVGLVGHIELGDRVMVGAQSGVSRSVAAGEAVSGTPAMPHRLWLRVGSALKRLPELVKEVRDLKGRIDRLEDKLLGEGNGKDA